MKKDKIILGIDPGTNILGYGVICVDNKGPHYVDMGVFDLRKIKDPFEKLGGAEALTENHMNVIFYENAGHGLNHEKADDINRKMVEIFGK